mmetsp:Transcript_92917/g.277286  ORF Transcript_92917/g.277286 Transcript_92917/m.277286 type:complete len:224 (+) Transcript_92917:1095-1766(+)
MSQADNVAPAASRGNAPDRALPPVAAAHRDEEHGHCRLRHGLTYLLDTEGHGARRDAVQGVGCELEEECPVGPQHAGHGLCRRQDWTSVGRQNCKGRSLGRPTGRRGDPSGGAPCWCGEVPDWTGKRRPIRQVGGRCMIGPWPRHGKGGLWQSLPASGGSTRVGWEHDVRCVKGGARHLLGLPCRRMPVPSSVCWRRRKHDHRALRGPSHWRGLSRVLNPCHS